MLTLAGSFVVMKAAGTEPEPAAPKEPENVHLSGQLVDLTCATKSYATTGKWGNAQNEHTLPGTGGKKAPNCARMCLKGGQPAGLFDGEKILAIFVCNPKPTLADFAAEQVEVQGYWTHRGEPNAFFPQKIRRKDKPWQNVSCDSRL